MLVIILGGLGLLIGGPILGIVGAIVGAVIHAGAKK